MTHTSDLTIRMASVTDAVAISRLAELDSAPRPAPVPTLVAEVGGELLAALPLAGGRAIADPFEATAGLVAILEERARQLQPRPERWPSRRRRLVHALRPAASTRA